MPEHVQSRQINQNNQSIALLLKYNSPFSYENIKLGSIKSEIRI